MNKLGEIINFPEEIRELYSKYDFEFFLCKIDSKENQQDEIRSSYIEQTTKLKSDFKKNRKQTLFMVDGAVRKMHSGGLLPSLFQLDETRSQDILDMKEMGKNWAYFDIWKKHEKKKILLTKFKKNILFFGALLAYVLTIIKIIEYLKS